MNESTEVIYNQIEADYETSFNMFIDRIPVDLDYYRHQAGCKPEDIKNTDVHLPGLRTDAVQMLSERPGHVVITFPIDENRTEKIGYDETGIFTETDGKRRDFVEASLDSVQTAQAIRIVLMRATDELGV